jgi:thymidylate synthase
MECPGSNHDLLAENFALRTPWEWARLALMEDKDSRQAIVKFHKRSHLWRGCKDQTCTMYLIFHIRDDALHLLARMRSNDVVLGLVYDMPFFISLQERMLRELRSKSYPHLDLGTYTHSADSMHLYDRNIPEVHKMLGDGYG